MLIGYARVSTREQDLKTQREELDKAGCEKVMYGKQSGASKENDQKLAELVEYVRHGDVVVVTKLDRLGRSLKMILQTLEDIHGKGAKLKTLDGVVDTSKDDPFSQAMVSLIGTFAELERNLIVSRTTEGREAAKRDGVKFGRKQNLSEDDQQQVMNKLKANQSVRSIAADMGITRQMVYRIKARNKAA